MGELFLKSHNKSFYWAIRFLPSNVRADVIEMYNFCRKVDIEVHKENQLTNVRKYIKDLNENGENEAIPYAILEKYSIDKQVLIAYLEALLNDVPPVKFTNISDLTKYCYGSAGTVGLMICHILGQKNKDALYNAINLGIAVKLIKVARDVEEDTANNKYYIPEQYTQKNIVILADYYFQSGVKAIPFLPKQVRLAVYSAAFLYRRIGKKIVQNQKRQGYVKPKVYLFEKMMLSTKALIQTLQKGKEITHEQYLHEPLKGMPFVHEVEK